MNAQATQLSGMSPRPGLEPDPLTSSVRFESDAPIICALRLTKFKLFRLQSEGKRETDIVAEKGLGFSLFSWKTLVGKAKGEILMWLWIEFEGNRITTLDILHLSLSNSDTR